METLGYWSRGKDVEHNEFCREMIGKRDGVGQSMQRSRPEIRGKQEGAYFLSFLDQGLLRRTGTYGHDKAICVTKNLFRRGPQKQLAQTSSTVRAYDH